MLALRNAFHKFKVDFDEASNMTISSPSLQSSDSSSRTPSDVEPRNGALNTDLQESTSRDDLATIPFEFADEDNFNDQESVAPLQTRSLFQSLQPQNNLFISSIEFLPSIESGTSSRFQADSNKSLKGTSVSGGDIPVDPISEFSKSKPSFLKKSRNAPSSSNLSAQQPESSQQHPFISSTLPPDGFMSALWAHKPDTANDFEQPTMKRPESPTDLPSVAFKSTNGHPEVNEIPESSNSIEDSLEVLVYPTEAIEPSSSTSEPVTQTSQSHDDSVTQISPLTAINDNDDDDQQCTPATKHPDPHPYSLMLPEVSASEDFPSAGPSTFPKFQSLPLDSTTKALPDSNISPRVKKVAARRKPSSSSFLLNLVTPQVAEVPDKVDPSKTSWGPLQSLQRINESGDLLSPDDPTSNNILARRMEELGRTRRMQLRSMAQPTSETTSQLERSSSLSTELLVRPLQTLQEDKSSDVATLLREAYIERQQALQTQLDKALADLRDAQEENKRLTTENKSQKRSISQLKIALDKAKNEHDHSLTQTQNQLRDATSSLNTLNQEKKGWQDKLESMQHKLSAAERHVRCLNHLTRNKLESRQDAGFNQPKRRKPYDSAPASPDIIALMRGLNEEIYQTCVQLADDLERVPEHTLSMFNATNQKSKAQRALGDHLTMMMENQAIKATFGYSVLLMQAVLEVFMTHWCSSIIEAFYPQQESFADLLIQLSRQTTRTSASTTVCGKQIQIFQSAPDSVKFDEWVKDIIKDLGQILTIAGLKMKNRRVILFSTKTLALVKVAYDLRTAMAEKDICGGLEVVIVESGTPFQEKIMIDAHSDPRKVDADQPHIVAGTSGIGLQRKVLETVNGQFHSKIETELKPKVILARALQDYN